MSKRRTRRKKKIFSRSLNVISIIVLAIFLIFLYKSNLLPLKYYKIIGVTLVALELIYTLICINRKTKKIIQIIFNFFAIIFIAIELFAVLKVNETINFLNNNLNIKFKTEVYYFVVNSESTYKKIKEIKGKTVYYYKDLEDIDELKNQVKNKVSVKLSKVESISDLYLKTNEKDNVILINSGSYDSLVENNDKYKDSTRILDKVEIKKKVKTKDVKKDLTNTPFTIYLSGIDTRSNSMPSRSLSDVNMFIVVNPKTRKILLASIPRDYYVQIHGTTGLKDKLTHAGALGGVELSKQTVEDLLGVEADYYARVNFNAVVNLVDAIDGITLYNDQDYSFTCWTDSGCTFYPGNNDVMGRCALAFARERHAYSTGDRHRGENQQQVIQKVLNKITSSTTIITNYSNILNALDGSFESSLTTDNIVSLVNFQINDMRGWSFETVNLDGTGANEPTYSYPNENLYVMYPNEETVVNAKTKINEIMKTE